MFQKPKAAKRLYFDVIPRAVDEYLQFLAAYPRQDAQGQARQRGLAHPRGHAAGGRAADHVRAAAQPRRGVQRARQGRAVGLHPPSRAGRQPADASAARPARRLRGALLRGLREAAARSSARPTRSRPAALRALSDALGKMPADANGRGPAGASSTTSAAPSRATRISNAKGATPDKPGVSNAWFGAIYQVLLGEEQGPTLRQLHRAVRRARTRAR